MATDQNQEWTEFVEVAARKMRQALANEITLSEASAYFENIDAIEDEYLRQFLVRYIWEIDGSRKIYLEILKLLEGQVTQPELIDYMQN